MIFYLSVFLMSILCIWLAYQAIYNFTKGVVDVINKRNVC